MFRNTTRGKNSTAADHSDNNLPVLTEATSHLGSRSIFRGDNLRFQRWTRNIVFLKGLSLRSSLIQGIQNTSYSKLNSSANANTDFRHRFVMRSTIDRHGYGPQSFSDHRRSFHIRKLIPLVFDIDFQSLIFA